MGAGHSVSPSGILGGDTSGVPGGSGGGDGYAGAGRSGLVTSDINPIDGTEKRTGGEYGGGGGGGTDNRAGNGSGGAVRIIWGAGRSFPYTNTGDV